MYIKLIALVFLVIFPTASNVLAAQSTDDVTASPELKESVRQRIMGARADQIARQNEYVIGHGDILSVSIFEEGDMSAASVSPSIRGSLATIASGGVSWLSPPKGQRTVPAPTEPSLSELNPRVTILITPPTDCVP